MHIIKVDPNVRVVIRSAAEGTRWAVEHYSTDAAGTPAWCPGRPGGTHADLSYVVGCLIDEIHRLHTAYAALHVRVKVLSELSADVDAFVDHVTEAQRQEHHHERQTKRLEDVLADTRAALQDSRKEVHELHAALRDAQAELRELRAAAEATDRPIKPSKAR